MTAIGSYIIGPEGPDLGPEERAFYASAQPLGFILFARNVETPEQLCRLTGDLRDAVGRDAPILVDQEGGRVQRLRAPHWREFLPPLEQVRRAGPALAHRAMYLRNLLIGHELLAVGIDVNCAPCADIASGRTHRFLRNRCYGETAEEVIANARATADGLMDAGVLPVLKHAPGHGRARVDSHKRLPVIDAPLADLVETDFRPFEALADLPMAMTAHLLIPEIDPDRPVTQSPEGIQLLREELGLSGFLMTDDISMEALDGSVAERGRAALDAGCDAVLYCKGEPDVMRTLPDALGPMNEAARARADAALARRAPPMEIDISAVEAELRALEGGLPDA